MEPELKIETHSVHLWPVYVPDLLPELPNFTLLLNENEMERAKRFRFEQHRQRFIVAHAVLRRILNLYTAILPEDIEFKVGHRGKPFLKNNLFDLQFNVSHSHDMAIYAITTHSEIGIDIEKMEPHFNEDLAKRFFSEREYTELIKLPAKDQIPAFYRIWSGKEAIIKALGEGLYFPIADFSLDLSKNKQAVELNHQGNTYIYYLENFSVNPEYQSSFATSEKINNVIHYDYTVY